MKRGRVYLLIFLLGALALSLAGPSIYAHFVAERFSGALAHAIQAAAATKNPWPAHVNFAKLPGPSWDAVHIFGPYTPPDEIEANLGFRWPDNDAKRISVSDSENLLVFVKGRAVVMSVRFPRHLGDFDAEALRLKYLPHEAEFTVQTGGGRPVLKPAYYTTAMAQLLKSAPRKPFLPHDPEWATFQQQMRPKLGQRVTVSGIPKMGKDGWWLPIDGGSIYVIDARNEKEVLLETASKRERAVTATGTLRYREGSYVDDPRVLVSAVEPIFYFDAADVKIVD